MLFDDMTLEEVRALDRRDSLEEGIEIGREEGIGIGREKGIGIGREKERERIFDRLIAYGMTRQEASEIVSE